MRSRNLAAMSAIWIGAFAITYTISRLNNNEDPEQTDDVGPLQEATRSLLEALPLQAKSVSLDESGGELSKALTDAIHSIRDEFHECVVIAMNHSFRPTEYFEFSFRIAERTDHLRLVDLAVDRSTLAFSAEDERCIRERLNKLQLPRISSAPSERLRHGMCFTNTEYRNHIASIGGASMN